MKRLFNFLLLCFIMLLVPLKAEAKEDWGVVFLSESHWGLSQQYQSYFIKDDSITSPIKKENYFGVCGNSITETDWTVGNNKTILYDRFYHVDKQFNNVLVVYFTGSSCGVNEATLTECCNGLMNVYNLFKGNPKYKFCIMETPVNLNPLTNTYIEFERKFAADNNIPIYTPSLLNNAYNVLQDGTRVLRDTGEYAWNSPNVTYPNGGFHYSATSPKGDNVHYAYRHYWVEYTRAVRYFLERISPTTTSNGVHVNSPKEEAPVGDGRYLMYEAKGCFNGQGGIDPLIGSFYTACTRLGLFNYADVPNATTKISDRNDSTGPKLALQYADGVIGDIVWASNYERLFKKSGQFSNCTSLADFWKTNTHLKITQLNTLKKACNEISPGFFKNLALVYPNINSPKRFIDEIIRYNESVKSKKAQIIIRVDNGTTEDIEKYNYFLVNQVDSNGILTAQCYDNLSNSVYTFDTKGDLDNCGITSMVVLNAYDCTPSDGIFRLSGLNSIGSLPCYPIDDNFYLGIEPEEKPSIPESKPEVNGNFSLAITGSSNYNGFTVTDVTAKIPGYKGQADFIVASDLHIIKDSSPNWDVRNGSFGGEDRVAYLQMIRNYATEKGLNTYLLGDIVDNATRANYDAIKPILNGWSGMTWVMADHDWLTDLTKSMGGGTPASDVLTGMQRNTKASEINGFKIISIGASNSEISTNVNSLFTHGKPTCILTHVPMNVKGTSEYTEILHKYPYNWTSNGDRWNLSKSPNMKSFNDILTKDNSCYFSVAGHTHQETIVFQNGNHAQLLLAPAFTKQFVVIHVRGI